jgi:four helix bundle suffix protein
MNGKDGIHDSNSTNNSYTSHSSHNSHSSHPSRETHPIIPRRGDPTTLKSFQKAEVVYDFTFRFAHKFLQRGDRTIDQMIQSARSGKKNILEGSRLGRTSREMEIKLVNVAHASLCELRDDYADYLRARDFPQWDKDSKEARFVRRLGSRQPQTYELYREFMETRPPDVLANIGICLIYQATYLIDRQLTALESAFIEQGGLREKMTRVRLEHRNGMHREPTKTHPTKPSHSSHASQNTQPGKKERGL